MKKIVALAVVIILIVTISVASVIVIQYATGNNWYDYSANVKSQQLERETLTFIKNVIQLDFTKYSGQVGDLPNAENPYSFQYSINYRNGSNLSAFEKNKQMLTITYVDINHTSISFTIYTTSGLVTYRDDTDNAINQTEGILERYQTAYNAPYIQEFLDSLNSYSTIENSSQQIGDFRLDLHSAYGIENITWSRAEDNLPNSFDTLTLTFKNGTFNSFTDSWNSFTIGSVNVNINQEKALQIANQKLQSVQNVPFDGGLEGISSANIDNSVTYTLSFQPIGNRTYGEVGTLFPCWQLNGNFSYIGANGLATASFYALIRADTGQILEERLGSYSLPA
jgi:uncharacterized protein YxeA